MNNTKHSESHGRQFSVDRLQPTRREAIVSLALSLFTCVTFLVALQDNAAAQEPSSQPIPSNRVVWEHVGRVYLNPNTGRAVYAGYLAHLNGIDSSLFDGAPSESSAHFTFSTDVLTLTPLPQDGDVGLSFVSAGTFNVYYNERPAGDWKDPASFSSGRLIATFVREQSFFPQIGPIAIHSLSERLASSESVRYDEQTVDFRRMTPNGITFSQFFSSNLLTGVVGYPVAFAAAGTTTAVGATE